MKRDFPFSFEFIYQVFSLIVIVIIVHAIYVAVIRPKADTILAKQAIQLAEDKSQVMERSVFVLVRDYEQEACFILMFWAIAIMGYKAFKTSRQRALLQMDLIPLDEGVRILPEEMSPGRFKPCHRSNAGPCCPERCWPAYSASVPPATSRMLPAPPMPTVIRKPSDSNPSCP
jgi:hypothetical protein